jgi:glutathione S-transferase
VDELRHFRGSHYNEKARWALDYKRAPHKRVSLLPGLHAGEVQKLTGQTATPILRLGDEWVAGSSAIIAALEARYPLPPLYPADAEARAQALAIEQRFDTDWGPRIRRAVFGQILDTPAYIAAIFAAGKNPLERGAFAAAVPMAIPLIKRGNGITGPESIADGEVAFDEAFAFVATQTQRSGYLVGDAFSVADLTAAAFLALALDMAGTPMAQPSPCPDALAVWQQKRAGHAAAAWVKRMYAYHRGANADFEGAAPYAAR